MESKKIDELIKILMELPPEKCNETDVMSLLNNFQSKTFDPFSFEKSLNLIEKAFNANTVEKILENLEKDNSEFGKQQAEVIKKMVYNYRKK